ncbi:MAG: magnesium/cobalt transporter CorA [Verrucomicrobiales bacterium]|nr:magnesium/cobalt transporter CorA [Verrucomicrobiales bacterium]
MIRSFSFTTTGRLHSRDIEMFLMPTLLADTNLFLWVDIEAATAEEARHILDGVFHFHTLSVEDCLGESPSPKVESYEPKEDDKFSPYLFMVIHAVDFNLQNGLFDTRELNFFLGKNFLVTYHPVPLRCIQETEDRCLRSTVHVARAPDRVAHALLDSLVDNYKPALEQLSLQIAELEDSVLRRPEPGTIETILRLKKEIIHLRQIIGPQREVMARFARGEFKLVRAHLVPYYRNVYDGLYHISELAQNYADSLSNILQIYLNISANQTSEVVKLLTLITVITTPLMIVGTWYGMNFESMPELKWRHGYLYAIVLTGITTVLTFLYFRRKRWL